ncbi:hypothetical protein B0T20DRAFT_392242 [Sordaria brevicollis]|uniref:Uncharacterized protein n=1 Tax=Sordaria brevicollis TaxID=83679 RepID=A0AAE0PG85_SORBR|nr:hypothetical protein B0T20DRAFT_392242 [Sordaria brevicollis]
MGRGWIGPVMFREKPTRVRICLVSCPAPLQMAVSSLRSGRSVLPVSAWLGPFLAASPEKPESLARCISGQVPALVLVPFPGSRRGRKRLLINAIDHGEPPLAWPDAVRHCSVTIIDIMNVISTGSCLLHASHDSAL